MDDEDFNVVKAVIYVILVLILGCFVGGMFEHITEDKKEFFADCKKSHTPTECHLAWRTGRMPK